MFYTTIARVFRSRAPTRRRPAQGYRLKFADFGLTSFRLRCNSCLVLFFYLGIREGDIKKFPAPGKVARDRKERKLLHSVAHRDKETRCARNKRREANHKVVSTSIIGRSKRNIPASAFADIALFMSANFYYRLHLRN